MPRQYFTGCATVESAKSLYRQLAMANHPDRHPKDAATQAQQTAIMQAINAEYQALLKRLDGTKTRGDDNKERTYTYDEAKEQALAAKISETLNAGIISDTVNLWLIGTWIWIEGDTKPIKDKLGKDGLGYRWHHKRAMWYFHLDDYKHYSTNADFGSLAAKYGATKFRGKNEQEIA